MPTFAPKARFTVGGQEDTIKGPRPAVCFTEQPLDAFIKSCAVLSGRYHPYGVVMHKWHLYEYGGRPVIYGDESLLNSLPDERKYLWVRYAPIPHETFRYPVDWTHEREWRAKPESNQCLVLGIPPAEGVPLLLPSATYPNSDKPVLSLPRVLVNTVDEAEELKEWIADLPEYSGSNKFLQQYFENLDSVWIVPLEEVSRRLEKGDENWNRLDTLPYKELDPTLELLTPEGYL